MSTETIQGQVADDAVSGDAVHGDAVHGDAVHEDAVGAFAERVFEAALGAMELQAMYLGDRLGWYAALAERGPMTAPELAAATGTAPRYAREWLEHQAVSGYLTVDDQTAPATAPSVSPATVPAPPVSPATVPAPPASPADTRRFRLPPAHAEVLANPDSLYYLSPLARFLSATGRQAPALLDAYRGGGGVSWEQYGADAREAQAALNRPLFLRALCQELLPAAPDVHARLLAGGRVADIGCGFGWSSIGLARGYPGITVDGYDPDTPSIVDAERNADRYGVGDRVSFHDVDAASVVGKVADAGEYDVAFAFECVHDMSDPVSVLAAARRLLRPDGFLVVMDERTEETFTAPGSPIERLFYGFSVGGCLPDGLSRAPSVGTGTVMRPATLAGYAAEAGFSSTEILPIEHEMFRFYRLLP
ncbi:methyltransferase domain-containing protein [Frankia sp. CNm7]|uniref:Methyltransferase domain-containing protein n=2 Tax=Frankia nepalensis TaxID=1836974 RepID=A0A937RNT5_9ACTN|nr:methyltransferase domain-containing protein [Frankia nepalensis]MBL7502777.1 methyltransferase domain-containing protein [Frankia nepalensis]MBL7516104.1 methyltransferase domain-containing protein [Frankia nepalensis]MBL7521907.1 methyltransferase domain-containing protein [Frankia nepalensis]MBL7632275.1 methyltransferase domain-containing protein [Frankia nepalensis]